MIGNDLAVRSLVGLALGASLISVFARLGGGIYTKAADVGADLVGKIESGLEEDDPRNPATIADNVGDNVGDCAGMAADVFETYAVSLIGAILVGVLTVSNAPAAIVYPFVLGGISVLGAICGILFVNFGGGKPAGVLMGAVGMSALVSAILFWPATHQLFPNGVEIAGKLRSPTDLYFASLIGLLMTGIVVVITNYYTSMHYKPVQKIARASETGHATNIIAGLALGQHATALPVGFIGIAILLSYNFAGLYGIAVAVMAMLSMAGIIISLDAFGPITDNAGGIAVMSNLPKEVRAATDELDAVGNTMKAVTKGYAIASAGLAALVLFGSYVEELRAHITSSGKTYDFQFSLTEPKGDYWTVHWRIAAVYLHRLQHGRGGQGGGRGCARSAAANSSQARHSDRGRHAGLRHLRGHRDESGVTRNDRAGIVAAGIRHPGGGDSTARPGRSGRSFGGNDCDRFVRGHRHDEQRWRLGQRQKIYRGRTLRRQRLVRARRGGHRRHRGRSL